MRSQTAALAVLFLLAHLFSLPPTLEDIDSVNFALGVRDFDVAQHQPHPPGYPVFIGLAKASTAALSWVGVPAPAPRGLAVLSALAGAALVPLLFGLWTRLAGDPRVGWWAMALTVCSPLFWFTGLRPLSDVTGLAFAVGAQLLLLAAIVPDRGPGAVNGDPVTANRDLMAGAMLAGLGAGARIQTVMLTAPLLVAALLWPASRIAGSAKAAAVAAAGVGAASWGIPLIGATGGLSDYLAALGTQAGEDFSGVVMLWTRREPGVAVEAVLNSFVYPWRFGAFGALMLVLAAAGAVRGAWRAPRTIVLLAVAFAPYAIFHLLFHETVTVRYALPLVLPVAFLAAYALAGAGSTGLTVGAGVLAAAALAATVSPAREYGRHDSPAFRAFQAAVAGAAGTDEGRGPGGAVAMHAVMRRVEEWHRGGHGARVLPARHGREWLALVAHWRRNPATPVRFLADPRRTDLELFDRHARQLDIAARWPMPEIPFVAGTRPGAIDVYTMQPPGWMLERGWALTAEIGGVTARSGVGPHIEPAVAWVRGRPDGALLVIGGRNLEAEPGPPARLTLSGDAGQIEAWDVQPGFFFRQVPLPDGFLAGSPYVPLRVSAVAADGSGRQVRVSLEQFDLQPDGVPMMGFVSGWGEPEYNPAAARAWRWMSERAMLWVRPVGRDVTLTLRGESPLRYFDRAPEVRLAVDGQEVGRFSPAADFEQSFTIPAAALAAGEGRVRIESDLWFSPADSGAADRRHLALRVYSVGVR